MIEFPLVFVDIDSQRDFLEPTGALYVPGSDAILLNLERLTRFAAAHAVPILATACGHTLEDEELKTFPPHCMLGTPGHERIEATACVSTRQLRAEDEPPDSVPPHLTLVKREYDVFSHPHADRVIRLYREGHPRFVVYGVATDYCVKAAVEGLLARDCRVALVVDAIRAIDAEVESRLLTDFARRGVLLTLTERVCDAGNVPRDHATA